MCARYYAVFIFKYRFVYFFNKIEFYLKLKLFDVTFCRERREARISSGTCISRMIIRKDIIVVLLLHPSRWIFSTIRWVFIYFFMSWYWLCVRNRCPFRLHDMLSIAIRVYTYVDCPALQWAFKLRWLLIILCNRKDYDGPGTFWRRRVAANIIRFLCKSALIYRASRRSSVRERGSTITYTPRKSPQMNSAEFRRRKFYGRN